MKVCLVVAALCWASSKLLMCQAADTIGYFPISIGNKYVRYESSTVPPAPSHPTIFAGDLVVRDSLIIDGKTYFYFPGICFGNDTITAASGGRVYYRHRGTHQLYYKFDADVGESWQITLPFTSSQSRTFIATLLSKTDTVKVTAGRFTNCIRIRFLASGTSLEYTDWLAPGVGLVFHGSQIPWELHEAIVGGVSYPRLVGVAEHSFPLQLQLLQNYPNPFNPETVLRYRVSGAGDTRLNVFDILGKQVITLVDEHKYPGDYSMRWDGRDHNGLPVASGTYLCRLLTGGAQKSIKLIKLK